MQTHSFRIAGKPHPLPPIPCPGTPCPSGPIGPWDGMLSALHYPRLTEVQAGHAEGYGTRVSHMMRIPPPHAVVVLWPLSFIACCQRG